MFSTATSALIEAAFGQGSGLILLDNLHCTGSESHLIDCLHSGIGNHDCSHSEDAGAVCACECYMVLKCMHFYIVLILPAP